VERKDESIKITYEPFKEIVIKEYTRFENIEDLIYIFAQLRAAGAPVALNWTNGIVFVYTAMPPDTEQLSEEFLKGKVYWANVSFAVLPQYKPVLETKEKMQVPVINASSNTILRRVAEWLKQQK
jgi:hypothetical protein